MNKQILLKQFKEWDKEDDIWTENLKHTKQYLGYLFLDTIIMGILGIIPMIIFGKNIVGALFSALSAFGYIFNYYNFYNWANNGLKAHLKFKKFKHGFREF